MRSPQTGKQASLHASPAWHTIHTHPPRHHWRAPGIAIELVRRDRMTIRRCADHRRAHRARTTHHLWPLRCTGIHTANRNVAIRYVLRLSMVSLALIGLLERGGGMRGGLGWGRTVVFEVGADGRGVEVERGVYFDLESGIIC